MTGLRHLFGAVIIVISAAFSAPAMAQAPVERYAGSAQLGSQPAFPIHIEMRRSGDQIAGTITIPFGTAELVEARGVDVITGRFQGDAGKGSLTLRLAGDALTGTFDVQGQPGSITARRTTESAELFFQRPAETLDLSAAQWLEDLDRLAAILTREHAAPFHQISRERFEQDVAGLRAAIPDMDGMRVAIEFHKLAALIGDGHTEVDLPEVMARLPLEFFWFDDGLRIVAIASEQSDLLGARLVAVNDVPVADVTERMRAFIPQGETEAHHRYRVADLMTRPDLLQAVGIGDGMSVALTVAMEKGDEKRFVAAASDNGAELATLGGKRPFWQENPSANFGSQRLEDGTVYVNWRSYDDLARRSSALLRSLDAERPRRMIIDLRDNDGGDFNAGRVFIEEIRKRPWLDRRGALYVMIGRKTFSAAMTNAVDFRQRTKAVLIGEPVGAAPNNWQEVRRFYLPNSGLRVGVSTRHYEFLPGEKELRPDHLVLPVVQDWGSPLDAATTFVLAQEVP